MPVPGLENKKATQFIRGKLEELADYMVTQGYDKGLTGSVMLGMGAGWVGASRGKDVAYKALDTARLAIEQHGVERN